MKKVIFAIFAHPDDEAFGASGTFLLEKAAGNEVHLICATAGEVGTNPDNHANLAAVRLKEWRQAGKLMQADSMHYLGFKDGQLCNNDYHKLAKKITKIVQNTVKNRSDIKIEFISGDFNGISGHLDHILMSRVAAYVFFKQKSSDQRFSRLRLICIPKKWLKQPNTNWLFMEAGRDEAEIDEVVNAEAYLDQIIAIMRAHHSQRGDAETHIKSRGKNLALNHYIVLN